MPVVLVLAALLLFAPPPAEAQTPARKVLRGFAAMTTSFLEVPGNMVAETRARGAAGGLPLGFAKGLGMIVPRTLVGVYEFVSAPFPAPRDYRPILEPEFPWDYFDEGPGARAESKRRRHR
jgi:putative exosortase-associated protein (TIGR04073 family)